MRVSMHRYPSAKKNIAVLLGIVWLSLRISDKLMKMQNKMAALFEGRKGDSVSSWIKMAG